MITLFILLLILCCVFGIGFKITGALLSALVWLCIKLPIAVILWSFAIACCCTLILIPIGMALFKAGAAMFAPAY